MSSASFYVTSIGGYHTIAKNLTLGTEVTVLKQDGAPIVVPESYDPETFADKVIGSLHGNIGFYRNYPYGLQRTYNDVYEGGGPFDVREFRDVASFALGYTTAKEGLNLTFVTVAGQFANMLAQGTFTPSSNVLNPPLIALGYSSYFAANPYGNGYARTGYIGDGTGYRTPAEDGPGPGVGLSGSFGTYDGTAGDAFATPAERGPGPGVVAPGWRSPQI